MLQSCQPFFAFHCLRNHQLSRKLCNGKFYRYGWIIIDLNGNLRQVSDPTFLVTGNRLPIHLNLHHQVTWVCWMQCQDIFSVNHLAHSADIIFSFQTSRSSNVLFCTNIFRCLISFRNCSFRHLILIFFMIWQNFCV